MGYSDFLKELLRPTGLYDLDEGAGAAELEVYGAQLDALFLELEELGTECLPVTASDYGLRLYEQLLPFRPAYITVKDERRALGALLRIRGGCFSHEQLQDTLAGCGLTAVVRESAAGQTVIVSFPQNRGIPEDFDKLKRRVEEILPCQLAVEYEFIYTAWGELMTQLVTWGAFQEKGLSWKDTETYLEITE